MHDQTHEKTAAAGKNERYEPKVFQTPIEIVGSGAHRQEIFDSDLRRTQRRREAEHKNRGRIR